MTSRTPPRFWTAYRELSPEVKELARKAYRLFSVRVTLAFRAMGVEKSDEITRFWIGGHADYDRLLKTL